MNPSRQETRTCAAAALSRWTVAVLESSGVPQDSARLAAGILVRTSLRGIDTHGLSRLPAYVDKLASGKVSAKVRPRLETVHDLLRCDGDQGLGQIVATAAMEQAMGMARTQAVVACSIASSGHLSEVICKPFVHLTWLGLLAPKGSPNEVVAKLDSQIKKTSCRSRSLNRWARRS